MQEHIRHQDGHCSVFAKHAAQQHPDQKLDKIPLDTMNYKVVIRTHKKPSGHHAWKFNAPTANEIAVVTTWIMINVESWYLSYYSLRPV